MTAVTIIIYIATILIWAATLCIATRTIKGQQREIHALSAANERFYQAEASDKATYEMMETLMGIAYVVRRVKIDGYEHTTIIKVFSDDDPDFNRREAEELVDKLNEK